MRGIGSSIFILAACAAAFAQADFSADIVNLSAASNTFHTKIFSTRDKLRIQGEDKSGRPNSIMIVDLARQTSIVLVPQQKKYVESSRPQIPGQGVTFFQVKNQDDACSEWKQATQSDRGKCTKVGPEKVSGRDTIKYEVTPAQGKSGFIWIDEKLHFPVKWQNSQASGELRNIKQEAQPAALFQPPPGYVKKPSGNGKPTASHDD